MEWFVSCLLPGARLSFVVSDPVVRARTHANEKAAKAHARIILRLLPRARVTVRTLDAAGTLRPQLPDRVRAWLREPDKL